MDRYVEVGVTAMRDPKTNEFLPAVPLYVKIADDAQEPEEGLIKDFGKVMALRMKQYMDRIREEAAV